jgi:glycyl-tRNA synthetase beta chain
MGSYYARIDGEAEEVALAATEHYQPRFAGDSLPSSMTGTVLALADKLETLVGIWGIGLQPTGDRDPFALRRHALGILRMLIEKQLPLTLSGLLEQAAGLFAVNPAFTPPGDALLSFMYDRLRGILKDRGFSPAEVEAVVAPQPDQLANILQRLDAVTQFAALPESAALAAANKRITNILKKTEQGVLEIQLPLLQEQAERDLYAAMLEVEPKVQAAFAAGDFSSALQLLAALHAVVYAFFNDVMVMAEDPVLRANRIALLASLHGVLNQVADISKLAA